MRTYRLIYIFGILLLACPALHAQSVDYLAKVKEFLDKGDCDRAKLAYQDYKEFQNSSGNAEVEKKIEECGKEPSFPDGQPCPGTPTVTDYDHNKYNTVQIGKQCWMKENLRTEHYADGTRIQYGFRDTSSTNGYYYYPFNHSNVAKHGYLYNWKAVMGNASPSWANPSGVQGICPNGWHVPSNAEWAQLTDYVGGQSKYVFGEDKKDIAKSLASTKDWSEGSTLADWLPKEKSWQTGYISSSGRASDFSDVCNKPESNNATGFTAYPAGYYKFNIYNFGSSACFWTSTGYNGDSACDFEIIGYGYVRNKYERMSYGLSVRCLRD